MSGRWVETTWRELFLSDLVWFRRLVCWVHRGHRRDIDTDGVPFCDRCGKELR